MNDKYFACKDCKTCIDAGYRWSWWTLVNSGIVTPGQAINIIEVLNHTEYWEGIKEAPWLAELLPRANRFLLQHKTHDVTYGNDEDFQDPNDELSFLDWLYKEVTEDAVHASPPYFLYRMNLSVWADVVNAVESSHLKMPWWWELRKIRIEARKRFDQLALNELGEKAYGERP